MSFIIFANPWLTIHLSWTKGQMAPVGKILAGWSQLLWDGLCVVNPPLSLHLSRNVSLGVASIMMQQLGCSVQSNTIGPIPSKFTLVNVALAHWCHNCRHRAYIRNQHPDYLVTTDCWPYFLYEDEHYDSDDPTKGLFKNILLVTVRHQLDFNSGT